MGYLYAIHHFLNDHRKILLQQKCRQFVKNVLPLLKTVSQSCTDIFTLSNDREKLYMLLVESMFLIRYGRTFQNPHYGLDYFTVHKS